MNWTCRNPDLCTTEGCEAKAEIERLKKIERDYMDLLMAVGRKFVGETRHQTALKYIKHCEMPIYSNGDAAMKEQQS